MLFGICVTFQRPRDLSTTLASIHAQSKRPDRLLVVDNSPTPQNEAILRRHYPDVGALYLSAPANLGPAGAIALGMQRILANDVKDDDWILLLDDDNHPPSTTVIEQLHGFAEEMLAVDRRTAAVGLGGGWFDWSEGWIRIAEEDAAPYAAVDYIGGGRMPIYRVGAVRDVGIPYGPLFFGWDDLEYGLRLTSNGYSLYADSSLWLQVKSKFEEILSKSARSAMSRPGWRWYYAVRNLIYICRAHGRRATALRVTLKRGIAMPIYYLLTSKMAARSVPLSWRACWDGWLGRMGRAVEPFTG